MVEAETRISAEHAGTPAGREALSIFGEEWLRLRFRSAARFHERKRSGLEPEWAGAAIDTDAYLCATRDELAEMVREYTDLLARWQERLAGRGQEDDGPVGARTVEVQFRAFPRDPRTPSAPPATGGESTGGRES